MRKHLLLICLCISTFNLLAQNRTVTGKVTDENAKPLPGASVSGVYGGGHSITDSSGNFTLTIPANVREL